MVIIHVHNLTLRQKKGALPVEESGVNTSRSPQHINDCKSTSDLITWQPFCWVRTLRPTPWQMSSKYKLQLAVYTHCARCLASITNQTAAGSLFSRTGYWAHFSCEQSQGHAKNSPVLLVLAPSCRLCLFRPAELCARLKEQKWLGFGPSFHSSWLQLTSPWVLLWLKTRTWGWRAAGIWAVSQSGWALFSF